MTIVIVVILCVNGPYVYWKQQDNKEKETDRIIICSHKQIFKTWNVCSYSSLHVKPHFLQYRISTTLYTFMALMLMDWIAQGVCLQSLLVFGSLNLKMGAPTVLLLWPPSGGTNTPQPRTVTVGCTLASECQWVMLYRTTVYSHMEQQDQSKDQFRKTLLELSDFMGRPREDRNWCACLFKDVMYEHFSIENKY